MSLAKIRFYVAFFVCSDGSNYVYVESRDKSWTQLVDVDNGSRSICVCMFCEERLAPNMCFKYSDGIDLNRVFKVLTFLRGSRSLSPHPALVLVLELEYKVLFGDILIFLALDADSCPAKCKSESKVKKPSYH